MTLLVHPFEQNQQQQDQERTTASTAAAAVDLNSKAVGVVPDRVSDNRNNSSMPTTTHNAAKDAETSAVDISSTYTEYHQTPVPASTLSSNLQQPQQQYETYTNAGTNRSHQQRAYSVTAMPTELLQKTYSNRKNQQQQLQEDDDSLRQQRHHHHSYHHHDSQQAHSHSHQPWWQYYYQLYHYSLPPGRKPTAFGPYLLLQTLGEGEFGKVKFGIEIKTGQEVAIKLIRKDSIDSASRMTKVEREISVLRVLHHPNIVELFDVIETEKYIGIILQCATGGELFDYILAHRYLKEKDASRLFAQLISGVNYMHKKHIVHRDLKLENLLLDRHRNVLITDFGFANQFSSAQDDLMSTSCGSPCYAAPELVMNQQGLYVGPAVDIWSCGVILFAMLCGYLPYDDDPANPESYNINLLYKYILNTPLVFPDYISEEACDLMSLMLVPDPEKRCTMETIMAHPWLGAHRHLFVIQSDEEEEEEVEETDANEEERLDQIEQEQAFKNDNEEEEEEEEEEDRTMITSSISTAKQEKLEENTTVVGAETVRQASNHSDQNEQTVTNRDNEDAVVPNFSDVTEHEKENQGQDEDTINENTHATIADNSALSPEDEVTDATMQEVPIVQQVLATSIHPDTSETDMAITTDLTTKVMQKEEQNESTTSTNKPKESTIRENELEERKNIRPESTASSTEKALHFLSGGHSSTSKSAQVGRSSDTNINVDKNANKKNEKKRMRHVSLVTEQTTASSINKKNQHAETSAAAGASTSTSILHSKFLSSVSNHHSQKRQPHHSAARVIASALPNFSLSTPHPINKSANSTVLEASNRTNTTNTTTSSTTKKRNIRLSTTLTPPTFTSATPPPPSSERRGTRRKTLSLLVNSMTENHKIPFTSYRRQSNNNHQQTTQQMTPTAEVTANDVENSNAKIQDSSNKDEQPRAIPSVSEHTTNSANKMAVTNMNNTTATTTKAEKHRSAGKKFMDWFKKKPLSSAHQKTIDLPTPINSSSREHQTAAVYDVHPNRQIINTHHHHHHHHHHKEPFIKLRTHHGAVDQEALTSRPPHQVFQDVKTALQSLGLEFKRDGSNDFKLKCSRPKNRKKRLLVDPHQKRFNQQHDHSVAHTTTPSRMSMLQQHLQKNTSQNLTNQPGNTSKPQQQNGIRSLLRRTSAQQQPSSTSSISSTENVDQKEHEEKVNQKKNITLEPTASTSTTAKKKAQQDSTMPPPIYGDPNVDPGEEIRFSIELCKIKNLPGLYIVDMRRLRGNVWAYKFIYRTLLDTLKLGGKDGYLSTTGSGTNNSKQSPSTATPTTDSTQKPTDHANSKGDSSAQQRHATDEQKKAHALAPPTTDNTVTVFS